jgi:hypothetical protein
LVRLMRPPPADAGEKRRSGLVLRCKGGDMRPLDARCCVEEAGGGENCVRRAGGPDGRADVAAVEVVALTDRPRAFDAAAGAAQAELPSSSSSSPLSRRRPRRRGGVSWSSSSSSSPKRGLACESGLPS